MAGLENIKKVSEPKLEANKITVEQAKQELNQNLQAGLEGDNLTDLERKISARLPKVDLESKDRLNKVYGVPENPRKSVKLPPMFVAAWPRLFGLDNGASINDALSKGYRFVEPDEVTNDPSDTTRIYVSNYQIIPMGGGREVVTVVDSVFMIGNRLVMESRWAMERGEGRRRIAMAKNQQLLDGNIQAQLNLKEVSYNPLEGFSTNTRAANK